MFRHLSVFLMVYSIIGLTAAQNSSAGILNILNQYGYTNFSSLLQNSSISDDIQQRSDLTILALNNGAFSDMYDPYSPSINTTPPEYYVLDGRYETFANILSISYINTLLYSDAGEQQIVICYTNLSKGLASSVLANLTIFEGGLGEQVIINGTTPLLNEPSLPVIWSLDYELGAEILYPPQDINTTLSYLTHTFFLPVGYNVSNLENVTAPVNPNTIPGLLDFVNNTLLNALSRENLLTNLNSFTNLTLFVPADQAWDAVAAGPGGINSLTNAQLTTLLEGHAVDQTLYAIALNGTSFNVTALNGATLSFTFVPDVDSLTGTPYNRTYVNNAMVDTTDILLPNGVIHIIDQVLYANATATPPRASSTGYAAVPSASAGYIGTQIDPVTSRCLGPPATNTATGSATTTTATTGTGTASSAAGVGCELGSATATTTATSDGSGSGSASGGASDATSASTSAAMPPYTGAAVQEMGNVRAAAGAVIGLGLAIAAIL